ncbi:MAG TPA: hypothetical protein VK140_02815 [Ktedonobacteraceae bacterium]|nr:hypothetical protein [Ktedonobacteraceae bacterium]
MLDHMQVSTLVSSLSALLEHAEFRQGVTFGRGIYYDLEYEGMLTEEQMVTLFERNLSRRACKRDERHVQIGEQSLSFLLRLGVVVGVVDEALLASVE